MREIDDIKNVRDHIQDIKVVLFDLDDTLYGEKEYVKSGYKEIAKLFPQIQGVEERLWLAFEQKQSAIDVFLQEEGIASDEIKQECLRAYREQIPTLHFYPGAEELLVDLRKEGYRLGVVTDGRPNGQRAKIRALRLEKYVDFLIVTDELGGVEYRKPNPKAFQLMREYFGVDYEDMCYVGDNIRKDFIAPKKLGMKAIYFKNKDGLYYEGDKRE